MEQLCDAWFDFGPWARKSVFWHARSSALLLLLLPLLQMAQRPMDDIRNFHNILTNMLQLCIRKKLTELDWWHFRDTPEWKKFGKYRAKLESQNMYLIFNHQNKNLQVVQFGTCKKETCKTNLEWNHGLIITMLLISAVYCCDLLQAGKVEDLLELMTSSGWSLTKFTKSTDAESPSKSSKKAPSDVRVSCLFTRCGCLGKQLHRKAEAKKSSVSNGQEPARGETTSDEFLTRESTPTSLERVTSNGQNGRDCQTQLTNDQSISISSLESDPSPASTPSEKQAEQYLEKYLPEKEASELKLLLRFFNINLPFVPKETDI